MFKFANGDFNPNSGLDVVSSGVDVPSEDALDYLLYFNWIWRVTKLALLALPSSRTALNRSFEMTEDDFIILNSHRQRVRVSLISEVKKRSKSLRGSQD
jgi:hypothetical protein